MKRNQTQLKTENNFNLVFCCFLLLLLLLLKGVCTDTKFKEEIAKLLRMESSKTKAGEFTSLDKYIENMLKGQKDIFFLVIPNRAFAESSPYFEAFKERNVEVLFLYQAIDDFVMSNLAEYRYSFIFLSQSLPFDLLDCLC
jgi:HSP90 family molecular chaperone